MDADMDAITPPQIKEHGIGITVAEETEQFNVWAAELQAVVATGNNAAWDVARLYATAERHPGWSEKAAEITGLDRNVLTHYAAAWRRRERLGPTGPHSVAHYRAVAALDDTTAAGLLARGLSRDALATEVRAIGQVAGLTPKQLTTVDRVVAAAAANAAIASDIPAIEAETRRAVVADLKAGTYTKPETYVERVGITELKALAGEILRVVPHVAIAAGGIESIRDATAALTDLVARYDAINVAPAPTPKRADAARNIGTRPGSVTSRAAWEADKGKAAKEAHDLAVAERTV